MERACFLLTSALVFNIVGAQTHFPEECNDQLQVRSAWPADESHLRFWLKGSEKYTRISVRDGHGHGLIPDFRLEPPFFTALFSLPRATGEIVVQATTENAPMLEKRISLAPDLQKLSYRRNYSILAYGCMEPFEVIKGKAVLDEHGTPPGDAMLRAFETAALSQPIEQTVEYRTGPGHDWAKRKTATRPLLAPVRAICATGDQVYVDAGYSVNPKDVPIHPLSAWSVQYRPQPLYELQDYVGHLDRMYRAFGSLPRLENVLARIPQISVWDDHEIRDGWGSQGDEYINGRMNDRLAPYYWSARMAFLQHQVTDSALWERWQEPPNAPMCRHFNVGGIKAYALDLRSMRDHGRGLVIGDDQWVDFDRWCSALAREDTILIMSSIPVFYYAKHLADKLGKIYDKELKDDLSDGWRDKYNKREHNMLVRRLIDLKERKNIRIIILSGDVHRGAVTDAWYSRNGSFNWTDQSTYSKKHLLAVELTTTGLYHGDLAEGSAAGILKWAEAARDGESSFGVDYDKGTYTVDGHYRWSKIRQNFGAIEVTDTALVVNLFLGMEPALDGVAPDVSSRQWSFEKTSFAVDFDKTFANETQWFCGEPGSDCSQWHKSKNFQPALPDQRAIFTMDKLP